MKTPKKEIILMSIILFLTFIAQCIYDDPENSCDYAPDDCVTEEPDSGTVLIKLNIDKSTQPVLVEVFQGKVDDGLVISRFTATENMHAVWVPNGEISAWALYTKGSRDTSCVVGGGRELSAEEKSYCEGSCYKPGRIEIDLRYDP